MLHQRFLLRLAVLPFAVAVLLAVGCDGVRAVSEEDIELMPNPRLRELLEKQSENPVKAHVLVLDPRPTSDYLTARIPSAQHLPLSSVPPYADRDPRIERYKYVVVYGDHPSSPPARALAKRLMSKKYKDIFVYDGGIADWTARGLKTEAGPNNSPLFPTASGR